MVCESGHKGPISALSGAATILMEEVDSHLPMESPGLPAGWFRVTVAWMAFTLPTFSQD